jgi:hypothetical protein
MTVARESDKTDNPPLAAADTVGFDSTGNRG